MLKKIFEGIGLLVIAHCGVTVVIMELRHVVDCGVTVVVMEPCYVVDCGKAVVVMCLTVASLYSRSRSCR